jgi:hypothetical protein
MQLLSAAGRLRVEDLLVQGLLVVVQVVMGHLAVHQDFDLNLVQEVVGVGVEQIAELFVMATIVLIQMLHLLHPVLM